MTEDSARSTATPSTDPINPEANRWLHRDASGRLHVTAPTDRRAVALRTAQTARVQALAARSGLDPEELAQRIPEDTLRRLKYPTIETIEADGTRSFKHDIGVKEGLVPLMGADREPDQPRRAP